MNRRDIARLKTAGAARTDADAQRLRQRHYEQSVQEIIRREKRNRRYLNRFRRAWKRLKRIW